MGAANHFHRQRFGYIRSNCRRNAGCADPPGAGSVVLEVGQQISHGISTRLVDGQTLLLYQNTVLNYDSPSLQAPTVDLMRDLMYPGQP